MQTLPLGTGPLLTAALLLTAAHAAEPPTADAPLSKAERRAVVDTLAHRLRERYVYPDRAETLAARLQARAADGGYDGSTTTQAFVAALDHDLSVFGDDRHFRVRYEPDVTDEDPDHAPTPEQMDQARADTARRGYGIERLQRLPGNIGYLDLRGFGPPEFVGPAFDRALALLQGTDALIVDLRSNGGGEPLAVSHFVSHFFAEGDMRHLNDIYDRPSDTTRQYWTLPVDGPRYLKPLMVLTSSSTASGGEECAYDLQTQKRATLVGTTTAGAAHPGGPVPLGHGITAFVPIGRPINPVTHADWEKIGVRPDIAVPAADAMKTAYVALLDRLLAEAKEPPVRDALQRTRQRLDAGEIDLPAYRPPYHR